MSDQPDRFEQVLTGITGLRADLGTVTIDLGAVKAHLLGVRTDVVGRMDRLPDPLTAIRDDIGVNMGRDAPTPARVRTFVVSKSNFGLVWHQISHLENRVRENGGDP